jgi:nuclear transport factor 2 (NTF2) superfamily protein
MSPESALLAQLYEAFNSRDVDAALGAMHPDVRWPNAWEGGYVAGREGVRDYWTRQWAEIDSAATPTAFETLPDGRIKVLVHVRATDRAGALLWDDTVTHTYAFESGKVRAMEVGKPG